MHRPGDETKPRGSRWREKLSYVGQIGFAACVGAVLLIGLASAHGLLSRATEEGLLPFLGFWLGPPILLWSVVTAGLLIVDLILGPATLRKRVVGWCSCYAVPLGFAVLGQETVVIFTLFVGTVTAFVLAVLWLRHMGRVA